jgi:hypothetical protein
MSRTLYFQDVPSSFNSRSLKQLIEKDYGRVESCRFNPSKQNAFLKIATRKEAEEIKQGMNGERLGDRPLKVFLVDIDWMGLRIRTTRAF